MFNDVTFGQYYPSDSTVHRLDPRIKLLITLAYIVVLFLIKSVIGYAIAFLFVVAAVMLSRVPIKLLLKNLKPLRFILILMFLINVLFTPLGDRVLLEFWVIKITDTGIIKAVEMLVRIVLLILFTGLLTFTTSPLSLTVAIELLLTPLKKIGFPAHELAMMMTIALRFIPTLMEETDKIMKAQMARGASFDTGNIFQKAKSMIPLLIPLFVSAFRRADDLALAMTARCYNGDNGRTRMNPLKTAPMDWIAFTVSMVVIAAMVVFNYLKLF